MIRLRSFALPLLILAPLGAQDDLRDTGPMSLVIQYRCLPSHRAQFRQAMTDRGIAQFESWKTAGAVSEYHILFSRYVDSDNWDMLVLVRFRKYDDLVHWRAIERRAPAGLPADTMDWLTVIETYPADLVRQRTAQSLLEHPVYLVVPYTLSVSAPSYLQFVDAYERPQLDGWAQEGIVGGYGFYMQRYTAARPWDSLLILEFKDELSLGAREKIAVRVQQSLQSTQGWQQLAAAERNTRVEQASVIADELGHER